MRKSSKIFLLVISEILGLIDDIFSVDNKSSLRNSENLLQPIKIQLSTKQETFSIVCSVF